MGRCMLSRRAMLKNGALAGVACALARRSFAYSSSASPVVRTGLGSLRGESSGGVRVFRGVPFAAPPVGRLRFRAPGKLMPWTSERDATRFPAAALQPAEREQVQHSEDCLYLNIWAPEGKGPFPVFVWIHGGGFTAGHAFEPVYDCTQFAKQGVLCISVGYRLGVLGFLDVEPMLGADYAGSANNALRDLIAALQWIQDHVGDFGGDPDKVTIGGESAGAKLADILMGVTSARPLFRQVISESGGAERVWPLTTAQGIGSGFAALWHGNGRADGDLLSAPGEELIEVQQRFLAEWPQHFPLRPMIDGTLLARLPVAEIAAGSARGKRLLIGTNRDESALFVGPHPGHDALPAKLGNMTTAAFAPVYAQYSGLYPAMSADERRIRALTAEEYWVPSLRVAEAHVKAGGSAWMYRLDFTETQGRLSGYAYHSLDVGLVWDKPHTGIGDDSEEATLAAAMHEAWTAFILGNAPAASGLPPWPTYELDKRATMILDAASRIEERPQEAERRVWSAAL